MPIDNAVSSDWNDPSARIKSLLPPQCSVSVATKRPGLPSDPRETVFVASASSKRRQEFITGRYAAHVALRNLGIRHPLVLMGQYREPLWPDGLTGSISHCDTLAVAVVAYKNSVKWLGIDLQSIGSVSRDLWTTIFTESEINFLNGIVDVNKRAILSTVFFSAKEAFFKLQFPATKIWIDFTEATVVCCEAEKTVTLRLKSSISMGEIPLCRIDGKFDHFNDFVVVAFCFI
jgi:4'-phosphopantetheinyl transferase EntD